MRIGSGSSPLPGCAPTADNATPSPTMASPTVAPPSTVAASPTVAPTPSMAPTPPSMPVPSFSAPVQGRQNGRNFMVLLLVVLLFMVVAGVLLFLRSKRTGTNFAEIKVRIQNLVAQYMPRAGAAVTNAPAVELTPVQQKIVSDYSPAKPIREAQRVKALADGRVTGQEAEPTQPVVPPAAPVAAGETTVATATPVVVSPEPPKPKSAPAPESSPSPVVAAPPVKPVIWPDIRITAVIGGNGTKSFARINGRLVSVGDTFDAISVTAIAAPRVTLAFGGQQRDFYVGNSR